MADLTIAAMYHLIPPGDHDVEIVDHSHGSAGDHWVVTVRDALSRTAVAIVDEADRSRALANEWPMLLYLYKHTGLALTVPLADAGRCLIGRRVRARVIHTDEGWANVTHVLDGLEQGGRSPQ